MNFTELDSREQARYISLARFAIGVGLLLFPRRMARGWFGEGEGAWPGTPVAMRAVGGRDLAIAVGTMTALENGGDVSAWLRAGATGDAADTAAIVLSFRQLGGIRRWIWPVISGTFTYVALQLAEELDA